MSTFACDDLLSQILAKLQSSIETGSFYEAHEMFKTVYYRTKSRGKVEESIKLLEASLAASAPAPRFLPTAAAAPPGGGQAAADQGAA